MIFQINERANPRRRKDSTLEIYLILLFYLEDEESIRGPTMGRITGSASIETLVRVGIEKVTKQLVDLLPPPPPSPPP